MRRPNMSDAVATNQPITIRAEVSTADVNTCKFTVNRTIHPGGVHLFISRGQAAGSPLVERLFEISGVWHVLVADDVVAIAKQSEASWSEIKPKIAAVIREQLRSGIPAILSSPKSIHTGKRADAEIRTLVQDLLDREVNPAVDAHGGKIVLMKVADGHLYIEMTGGCQGCASSQLTLRQGFERMVRRAVPDVVEIIDVTDHLRGQMPYYRPGS
jgi:Fe-S cluster biogenesis protein NfuA